MNRKLSSFFIAFLLFSSGLYAQTAILAGKVTANGEGVIGASVQVVGTKLGVATDATGAYRMSGVPAGKTIIIIAKSVGYSDQSQTLTLKTGETKTLNFDLEEGNKFLEDVVVTGLAINAKQKELGTSRSSLNEATLKSLPAPTIENALVGRMAGVEVYSTDGAPGGGFRFRIRGGNSIVGASEPLVIIDGMIMDNSNRNTTTGAGGGNNASGSATFGMNNGTRGLQSINPDDIESIEVLKGAAAASLYGSRASSGVIVVKTKSGGKGGISFDYGLDIGTSKTSKNISTYKRDWSASEIDQWNTLQKTRVGATYPFVDADVARWKTNTSQDWTMEGLQRGSFQRHNVRLSGGDKLLGVYAAVSTQTNTGNIKGTSFDSDGLRFALTSEPLAGLSLRTSIDYSDDTRKQIAGGNPGFFVPNAWSRESAITPVMPFMSLDDAKKTSPVAGIASPDAYSQISKTLGITRLVWAGNINYKILSNLAIDVNAGIDQSTINGKILYPVALTNLFPTGRLDADREELSQKTLTVGLNHAWQITENLYLKSAVGTQYDENTRFYDYKRVQTKTANLPEDDITSYTAPQLGSYFQVNPIVNTFGIYFNETLGISEKLFLNVGGRFDKSTSIVDQFFFYPRGSLSYAITPKIRARAAYGTSGTQPAPYLVNQTYRVQAGGYDGSARSYLLNAAGNGDLKPEKQTETEFGVDANLMDGRLNIELTYYNKLFTDLLLNAPLAPNLNHSAFSTIRNIGEMYNRGIEFAVSYDILKRDDLSWNMGVTGATLKNEMTFLNTPSVNLFGGSQNISQIRVGYPIGGLFAGTLTSAPDTRTFIGGTLPKLEASLNNVVTYKGFTLRALLGGKWGHYRFNETSRLLADPTKRLNETYWNTETATLSPVFTDLSQWIQSANFVKLRQLSLSYNFPTAILENLKVKKLSVSVVGSNLITWTKYRGGYDVEAESSTSGAGNAFVRGVDAWEAGLPKSWTFSLNIGF